MKCTSKFYAVLAAISLSACTSYQQSGFTGGYEEKQIEPGVYDLYFYFNGPSALFADNTKSWHKRAAELCGGPDKFEVLEGPEQVMIPKSGKHGKIKCKS